jgi:hypothetical protein
MVRGAKLTCSCIIFISYVLAGGKNSTNACQYNTGDDAVEQLPLNQSD